MTTPSGNNSWQPMSPDEIRRAPLRESGLGRRGYRPEDVDRLRNQVAVEIERWARAYTNSEAEVQRLREYYRHQGLDVQPERPVVHAAALSEAAQLMAQAQAYADQLVADAQAQARHMQADARSQAEHVMAQARQEADEAGQAYRARAGQSYSADREETERLAAWARSILATMEAVQHQLGLTAKAFSLELAKFVPEPSRAPTDLAGRPPTAATPVQHSPFD